MKDMSCHLQRWIIGRGHHCNQYWIFNIQAPPNSCCSLSSVVAVVEDEVDVVERTLAVMEADEEARLREEDQRHPTFDCEQLVRRAIPLLYVCQNKHRIRVDKLRGSPTLYLLSHLATSDNCRFSG